MKTRRANIDRLSMIKTQRTLRRKQYNVSKLKKDDNRLRFTALVENKVSETITRNPNIDTVWEEISSALTSAAEDSLDLKGREPSSPWFDED